MKGDILWIINQLEKSYYKWASFDFGKPGLPASVKEGIYAPLPLGYCPGGNTLTVFLKGDAEAAEELGCPRRIILRYHFLHRLPPGDRAGNCEQQLLLRRWGFPGGRTKLVLPGQRGKSRHGSAAGHRQGHCR